MEKQFDIVSEAKNIFDKEIDALLKVRDSLGDDFITLVNLVVECEGKVVLTGMGKPGHIGTKIAATLASLGTPSFFMHPGEALHGDLGMGKSEIARAVIQTLRGADTVVPSPTFTIVQSYDGISHFDLYRIEDTSELTEIGLAHAIQNDITLIEWPEIAETMLPTNTIHLTITQHGNGRKITQK